MEEQKYQWYLISYTYNCLDKTHGNGTIQRGFAVDEKDRNITKTDIAKLTEIAKMACKTTTIEEISTFFITAISYLGYMTEKEFKGEEKCP